MPYITSKQKAIFDKKLKDLLPVVPGELNYCFTKVALQYIKLKGKSYQSYNDIIGALEACKLELYRREITKYEDKKIFLNGDVYE